MPQPLRRRHTEDATDLRARFVDRRVPDSLFELGADEAPVATDLDARKDAPPGVVLDGRDLHLQSLGYLPSGHELV
jgi:hypothetical protein